MTEQTFSATSMTLEQARNVRWQVKPHHTMGHMLDQGQLGITDLQWAREKAYRSDVREAAEILLGVLTQPLIQTTSVDSTSMATASQPMTLEQARNVRWQVKPHHTMGHMLDQGRLSVKDLRWAIENAHRSEVREAAVLLLEVLMQSSSAVNPPVLEMPSTLASQAAQHHPQIFRSNDYLQQLESRYFKRFAGVLGLCLIWLLALPVIIMVLANLGTTAKLILTAGFLSLGFLSVAVLILVAKPYMYARTGHKGEQQVFEKVLGVLDNRWTVYRNVQLPGRRDDLDLVLIGPSGVWLFEIKNYSQYMRIHQQQWQYRRGKRWLPVDNKLNPAYQVSRNAKGLHDYFQSQQFDQYIQRLIVFVKPQQAPSLAQSPIPIWQLHSLADDVRVLYAAKPLAPEKVLQINQIMQKLIQLPLVK